MALRAVLDHPKLKRLQKRLGLSRFAALGILESLWHMTSRYAPRGDIGKMTDEDIALWIDWEGEPEKLVDALVDCGWLDRCSQHRLVTHDWQDHADDASKLAIKRKGLQFVGTCRDSSRLPEPEPEPVPEPDIPPTPQGDAATPLKEKAKKVFASIATHLPREWAFAEEAWQEYQLYRHRLQGVSPYQETGCQRLAAMLLAENYAPDKFVRLLNHCIVSGWKGIPVEVLKSFEHSKANGHTGGLKAKANEFYAAIQEVTVGTEIVRASS